MKYLSLVFFFCSAHSMDPMEAPQRATKRSEKYRLFIKAIRYLEEEEIDPGYDPIVIYPSFVTVLENPRPEFQIVDDWVIVRGHTGVVTPRLLHRIEKSVS